MQRPDTSGPDEGRDATTPTPTPAPWLQALLLPEHRPPSERHLRWLRKHGYTGPMPTNQREASDLVNRLALELIAGGKDA